MEILSLLLLAALISQSNGDTCSGCFTTYSNAKAGVTNAAAACTVADAYITCLETATGAGCPPASGEYTDLQSYMTSNSCSMTTLCTCQRDHMQRVSSATDLCISHKEKLACISGDLTTACDDSDLGHTLATGTASSITDLGTCTLTDLCTCEKDYAVTDISVQVNRCTAKKVFIGCIRGKTDAACKSSDTVKTLADEVGTTIATDCSGFASSVCACELTYTQTGISSEEFKCTALKTLVTCLGGVGGAGCASGTTASSIATGAVSEISADSGCITTSTCDCEGEYAKHDISTTQNKCEAQKKLVACLVDKTDVGCTDKTPVALGTSIASHLTTCSDFPTTSCSCLLTYIQSDISDSPNKCTAKTQLITCLLGKGPGCLSSDTAKSIATQVIDTDVPALSCDVTSPTCACETTYAKASLTTDAEHCTALGIFVECLKKKTATGCSGTTVTALGTKASTNYATLIAECPISQTTCGCEVAYIQMPYDTATAQCTAEKTLVSCLKGNTGSSCKEDATVISLATAAGTSFGTITDCPALVTDTCSACELVYAKADISTNTAKCTALATYLDCLKGKTNPGCVSSDTVAILAGSAESSMKAISPSTDCPVTTTCQCEINFIKADRSDAGARCTAAKTLISCVKGLTPLSCDGSTKASAVAADADTIITADCGSSLPTDTCKCEISFAKEDMSASAPTPCNAKKDYMDCLSKAYDLGCDGTSKRNALATAVDISSCTPSDTCECQNTYALVDNTDNVAQCSAIMAHLACLDSATATGCKTATTIIDLATLLESQVGTTSGCVSTESCKCQTTHLKATRDTEGNKCLALKAKLSCLMLARDDGCDGTTSRDAIVTAIKSPTFTCTLSSTCTGCMIPYGEASYSDATAHCTSIKTLMTCLSGKNVFTDTGCDDSKTIETLVGEFEAIGSCSFTDTCTCQISYMKGPGTDAATKCAALRDYMHCVDGVSGTNCDGTETRDAVATTIDTAIVDGGSLSATCETDLTTTCSSCQIVYAMKDPTIPATHCTDLYIKLGCLAGETTSACKTSVAAHIVAAAAKTTAEGISLCAVTSDTCSCEVALAITDITLDADHCSALYAELSCLKGKTNTGCDSTTVEALGIKAMKALDSIGSCSPTPTCSCEITFAKADISTEALRCTASLTELACLHGETAAGCDGSSTVNEIDMSIKQWMDTATTANGATNDKCTTDPVCLCEIAYAVAVQGTNAEKCTALKNFIVCLSGETGTGCDGTTTVTELATTAHTAITNLGADCPVSEACLCEIAFVKADISTSTKECTELLTKMECLYKTEEVGCVSTTRDVLATAVATRMSGPPNCASATSTACTCMIDYAKVDPTNSAGKCTGLQNLLDCLDGLDPLTVTSCDGSQTVVQLATGADDMWAAMGNANCADKTDTCTCTVDFLKAGTGSLCIAYLTKMDCLVASEGANCKGVDRHTYAGTTETALNTACGVSAPTAGSVCKDCEIAYAKVAPTCTTLLTYYNCLYTLRSGSSCNSKTVKDLVMEQDTNFATLGCTALDDTCQCQMDYLKSTLAQCQKSQVIMNCLWEATATACDSTSQRSVIATSADTDIDNACRSSLSDVCSCQISYAKVDPTDDTAHCTALKTQFMCLEGKSGTGCENTRTFQEVASGGNAKLTSGCARTAACDCQIAYLIADISTSPLDCTETQKKVACLYATTTAGCDDSTPRTTLMTNTDATAGTCGYTSSCGCQRTYGKATGGDECGYQSGVITCLQDTVDTGCTGESAFTKTRTELATDVETYLTTNSCPSKTDTCQCQIDYAKATVDPTSPDKCKALGELIICLAGKTNTGCDTTSKASDLAAAAHSQMQTDSCSISQTCACQITYAEIDHSTGSKCTGLLNEIECVYGTEDKGCDTTTKRSDVAAAIVAELTTESCTASATDTCKTCVYDYAKVDVEDAALKCSKLGELLHCLDGKTATSCKSPSPATVIQLATNAKAAIDALGSGCSVVTDTCMCQYTFMTTVVGDNTAQCNAQAQRMECLVASTGVACDGSTTRSAYAATAEIALNAVSGCSAALSTTCTACEIVYAKATSDTPTNRCSALKAYFHCLDSQTTTSCFGSKTINTLASEANTRAVSDSCSLGETCTCQANYLMSTETKCIALKNKMSCLAVSYDLACDNTATRDAVATTTDSAITSESCTGVTAVCTCERTYAKTAFPDSATHCTNLKTAVNCLEGETAAGCGATATISSFSTAVLTKINALMTPTCTLSDTCSCQVTYLSDDISSTTLKCTALEKKQACLYLATSTACDGSTTRKDTIISVDGDIGTASCSIPSTCQCQINYGKATITPDTAKCTAMKTMIQCLQDTSDDGCRGTTTQTRTQLATSVESFAGTSGDCTLSDACVCQKDYAKADVTGANYCTQQKSLAVCLGTTTTTGCTGTAPHTLASTAVGVINGIVGCPPASGTTCKCQLDHAVADRSTLPLACTATKALIKCLELSTGVGCTGDSKDTIAGNAETYMNDGSKSCAITSTCACQIELAKTNIDVASAKCSALKTKLVCMRSTNDVACGGETKVVEATNTETTLNSIGDATCHVEDSCRCEITHAKTDTSSDTCTPAKTLVHCLTMTTEAGCTSTKLAVGNGAKGVIDSHGSCPLTASCTCQATVVTTSTTTDTTRCTAYKTLAMCLGADNDVGCDGAATKISLATSAESIVKGIGTCNAALTTTCQCEINYAKSDTSTNALKCSAYNKELTCLFSSMGSSCLDAAQGRHQVATTVDTAVQDAALSCPAQTDECSCTTTYAKTDITANADKCTAAKALLSCMSGKTGTGCDGIQTAVNIVSTAETAIQDVVTAGGTCSLTDSCQCEVTFSKADSSSSTYCDSAITYFGCLYTASAVGCSGTSNADLQTAAKNKIATISGCQLPDTCQCQETYRINYASDASQQCKFVKNALSCLATSSEKSCDRSQNHVEVTTQFETLQTSITSVSCFLTETCKCQVAYGKANITTSFNKCIAAHAYNTCLGNIPNDQDVGCDDITQKRHLTQGPVKAVLGACRGCSLSKLSLMTSLVLVLVALMVKH